MMMKKQKDDEEKITRILTAGEIIDELRKLPKQAEVRFSDVCGNHEAELYQVAIDANKGTILLIGEYIYDDSSEQ